MLRARLVLLIAALAVVVPSLPAVAAAADSPSITKVSPAYGTTAGGTTFDKSGFQYARPAARPVGAGYLVPHRIARSGNLRLVVPRLTCGTHENSELGVAVQPVKRLRVGFVWAGDVTLRCVNGSARYDASLRCDGPSSSVGALHPRDTVDISYGPGQVDISIGSATTGTVEGCGWASAGSSTPPASNLRAIAFLVKSASRPPASLQALTVHVKAGGHPLSADHPTRQSQRLSTTTALRPTAIRSDGKTFTARVQHR